MGRGLRFVEDSSILYSIMSISCFVIILLSVCLLVLLYYGIVALLYSAVTLHTNYTV